MSVLANYIHLAASAPLYANYELRGAIRINSWKQMLKMKEGVFAFDEAHVSMDSRNFKDRASITYTHWLTQLRKKQLALLYTTQHISQVDIRLRNLTDILALCQNINDTIKIQFLDWQYLTLGRRYTIWPKSRFYSLYDTFQVVDPIVAPSFGQKKPYYNAKAHF